MKVNNKKNKSIDNPIDAGKGNMRSVKVGSMCLSYVSTTKLLTL